MNETARTKWLQFEREVMAPNRKTPIYYVYNHSGEYLGKISWYSQWRQYCYMVEHDDSQQRPLKLVLAKSCLDDIADFIQQLMNERKSAPAT